jgi:hypothetical protein
MTLSEFAAYVEFSLRDFVAGVAGGVVHAIKHKDADPWSIIGSVVAGGLSANYIAVPLGKLIGINPGVSGFIIGMAWPAIHSSIIESVATWRLFRGPKDGQ